MIKLIFHVFNIILAFLYLYPGSILGFFIYGNYNKQPQISGDFLISSNHVYAFLLLSILGLISYFKTEKNLLLPIY